MSGNTAAPEEHLSTVGFRLAPFPDGAEVFETSWPVRLGDTDSDGRLRLDAVARYLQDAAYDNLKTAPEGRLHQAWLIRRTVMDVLGPIEFGEQVRLRRWAGGLSEHWVDVRVRLDGENGGVIDTTSFGIHIDPVAGRPARMTDRFKAPMLAHTTDHRLRWKAMLREFPGAAADETHPFPLRVTDFDWLRHVNNAVYWEVVEEHLPSWAAAGPYRGVVEHVGAVTAGDKVEVRSTDAGSARRIQVEVDGTARALALIEPIG
ncbi:acyl-[acyl-carrier-protein] thioesterase [Nocardia sp. BMG51109]|uniref:acyl-[acyl-carrier-protein] thioesterase n=1 Tax=Nocardia sp. BMG51109 TaxID=1056816 RepID=UPI0004646E59|nr:acyl-ACP thioesterase domain-containing protein [Nocardia sp. BMG51109]